MILSIILIVGVLVHAFDEPMRVSARDHGSLARALRSLQEDAKRSEVMSRYSTHVGRSVHVEEVSLDGGMTTLELVGVQALADDFVLHKNDGFGTAAVDDFVVPACFATPRDAADFAVLCVGASKETGDDEVRGVVASGGAATFGDLRVLGAVDGGALGELAGSADDVEHDGCGGALEVPGSGKKRTLADEAHVHSHNIDELFARSDVGTAEATKTVEFRFETTLALYQAFGNSESAMLAYLSLVLSSSSHFYEIYFGTNQIIKDTHFYTSTDPFSSTTDCGAMLNLLVAHKSAHTSSPTVDLVHLFSTATDPSGCGGIAYVDVLCSADYQFGLSLGFYEASGRVNSGSPYAIVWDLEVFMHEVGHNYGSGHTFDFCNKPTTSYPFAIDRSAKSDADACNQDALSNVVDATAGGLQACPGESQGCGTIMSYVQSLSGGMANLALSFGRNADGTVFAYGRNPERSHDVIKSKVDAQSTCLALVATPAPTPASGGSKTCTDFNALPAWQPSGCVDYTQASCPAGFTAVSGSVTDNANYVVTFNGALLGLRAVMYGKELPTGEKVDADLYIHVGGVEKSKGYTGCSTEFATFCNANTMVSGWTLTIDVYSAGKTTPFLLCYSMYTTDGVVTPTTPAPTGATPAPTQYPTPNPTDYPTPQPVVGATPSPTQYPTPNPVSPAPTDYPTPQPAASTFTCTEYANLPAWKPVAPCTDVAQASCPAGFTAVSGSVTHGTDYTLSLTGSFLAVRATLNSRETPTAVDVDLYLFLNGVEQSKGYTNCGEEFVEKCQATEASGWSLKIQVYTSGATSPFLLCYSVATSSGVVTGTPLPTQYPTPNPSAYPTPPPSAYPTPPPSSFPTPPPSAYPTPPPSAYPTPPPSAYPTPPPSAYPTPPPSAYPTPEPPGATPSPTQYPTPPPTDYPTPPPSAYPTPAPTQFPTPYPTQQPVVGATNSPTAQPVSLCGAFTSVPAWQPSACVDFTGVSTCPAGFTRLTGTFDHNNGATMDVALTGEGFGARLVLYGDEPLQDLDVELLSNGASVATSKSACSTEAASACGETVHSAWVARLTSFKSDGYSGFVICYNVQSSSAPSIPPTPLKTHAPSPPARKRDATEAEAEAEATVTASALKQGEAAAAKARVLAAERDVLASEASCMRAISAKLLEDAKTLEG